MDYFKRAVLSIDTERPDGLQNPALRLVSFYKVNQSPYASNCWLNSFAS